MSILIVSNMKKDLLLLKGFLQNMDIGHVQHYPTVDFAISQMADVMKAKIDVILLDAVCTTENREKVYGEIAKLRQWSSAPVMLVTCYDTRETIEGAFFAGIFDFILKPLDIFYFKARLHIAIKYNYETRKRIIQDYNLQKDLAIARNVQKNALASSLDLEWLQIDGFNRMSHTLGGDMYYWSKVSERTVAVVLYDVMGHGVASSLISMSIRSILKESMTHLSEPVTVIQELNRHIYDLFECEQLDGFLVTAIYLLIDLDSGTIEYVNASHPSGFIFGEGATYTLATNTPILGLLPNITPHKQQIAVSGQQRLVLYTDGLQHDNQLCESQQFLPYLSQRNETDLKSLVQDLQLEKRPIKDDISIVFITINYEGA